MPSPQEWVLALEIEGEATGRDLSFGYLSHRAHVCAYMCEPLL